MKNSERIKANLLATTYALDMAKRADLAKAIDAATIASGVSCAGLTLRDLVALMTTRLERQVNAITALRKRVPRSMMTQARNVLAMRAYTPPTA